YPAKQNAVLGDRIIALHIDDVLAVDYDSAKGIVLDGKRDGYITDLPFPAAERLLGSGVVAVGQGRPAEHYRQTKDHRCLHCQSPCLMEQENARYTTTTRVFPFRREPRASVGFALARGSRRNGKTGRALV